MIQIVISLMICAICFVWNINTDDNSQKAVSLLLSMIFAMIFLGGLHNISPTAMDVYAGKTTLKYEIIDGIKVDSTVVFKKEYEER